jgi:SpoVK/Ycf46/Vps4 family AAA+-type ATPase
MLKDIKLDPSLTIDKLAKCTEGRSGSDLKEICRNAAMIPVRERMRRIAKENQGNINLDSIQVSHRMTDE